MWGTVEVEPEVARWLANLSEHAFGQAEFAIDRLARDGPLLGEPQTRQLSGKLRELRFSVEGAPVRVTYFLATGKRAVLLTVFSKRAAREPAEIRRAEDAMRRCLREGHSVEDEE